MTSSPQPPYPGQLPGAPQPPPAAAPAPSPTVQYYQDVAAKEEKSPLPWLLKLCRAIVWVFYVVVVVNTVLLGLAFLLELFGANPHSEFVAWIYRSTARAMQPFHDIFPPVDFSERSVLDMSLLFAIVIYLILVVVLHTVLNWLQRKLIEQQTKMAQARATADAVTRDEQVRVAAAQEAARQAALRQDALRQEAARQETLRQEAARQTAAAQAAAAAAVASQAAAQSAAQSAAAGYQATHPTSGQLPPQGPLGPQP